ncbi:DUF4166 domain-containing protein [Adhaeribacter soli]|uniref:DUF4166 domain-containing protein n=1 Tax=Adhaeribacter soli TaxID=2607655 RepID=A0A5N1J1I7_9BACT|nr:DUF4166 domain-containing protein [Adhaeribacter soli]KAA9340268.1 DUF4166 domain-containing protein [Adhaeribacter soli]
MSIYKKYLGSDFEKLHPKMQQRFGMSSRNGLAMIGTGKMDRIWNAGLHTLPFLHFGTLRNIMFPETGTDIPFSIENYVYEDSLGRETVTWIRKFHFPEKLRRFDATMIYSEKERRIIDYLGNKQHLAVDIDMHINSDGSVTIRSGNQRFYEGPVAFNFPDMFSGNAEVNEAYDEEQDLFRISVKVSNKTFGDIFGYNGWFKAEFKQVAPEAVPAYARPLREEVRE